MQGQRIMAPKKGAVKGGQKRSKKADQEAQAEPQAEEQPAEDQDTPAQDEPTGDAPADQEKNKQAEEGADGQKQDAADGKGDAAGDAATQEPAPKRQATDAKKAELEADAPIGGGAKPGDDIEEGRIYFIYRPKVSTEHAHGLDDVQRFFFILSPTSRKDAKARIIAVGKKRMPSAPKHERFFGFVYTVADGAEDLMQGLGVEKYETKTQGTREQPAARIVGEGLYAITGKDGSSTKLAYTLELPQEPDEVQKDLGIEKEAAYIISIKNPDIGSPANAGLKEKADFVKDDEKMKQFGNKRWIGVKDPSLLDYPRAELLLIGGGAGLKAHVDKATEAHLQQAEHDEIVKALHAAQKDDKEGDEEAEEAALVAKMHAELHPEKEGVSTDPAAEGKWE